MKRAILSLILTASAGYSHASSFMDQFIDPTDGFFDASQFLLDYELGFLPVPIMITEPAVGNGAGLAVLFFHESETQKKRRKSGDPSVLIPPSITAVAGAATSNGSKFAGLAHLGSYNEDNIRYEGIIGHGDVNIALYLDPSNPNLPFEMNGRADMTYHQLALRVPDTRLFLGVTYDYMDIRNRFIIGVPEVDQMELYSSNASAGLLMIYDTLNSPMTPTQGFFTETKLEFYDKSVGGDFNYRELTSKNQYHHPIGEEFVLAARIDADFTEGDIPFYGRPSVDMKGIPAARYQGDNVLTAEVKGTWNFHPRFSVSAFTGGARAADKRGDLNKSPTRSAIGMGFRYMIIRQLGMNSGVDIAKGPEESAVYLSFGSKF